MWLNGDRPEDSFHKILNLVINDNLLNEVVVNGKPHFRDIVYKIFQDLSKYVHYGGIINPADLKLTLSEYNKEHFENWFEKLNQINEIWYPLQIKW